MRLKSRNDPPDVRLSEREMQIPYSHLFFKPPSRINDRVIREIDRSPYPEKDALLFDNINNLLNPGYLSMENGYVYLSDGSIFVSILTDMPGITGEMIDWWFWWNPQDPLRYKIMYPEAHFGTGLEVDIQSFQKRTGPYHQRLWDTTTYPVEDVGAGKDNVSMQHIPPENWTKLLYALCAGIQQPCRNPPGIVFNVCIISIIQPHLLQPS